MADDRFDLAAGLLAGTAATPARFAGFPPYMFVGGNNDPDCIPVEGFVQAAADVLRRHGSNLAVYNMGMGPQGYPPLRAFLANKLNRHRGMSITADDILITTGSNQGIDLTLDLFVGPGDVVLTEALSYSARSIVFASAALSSWRCRWTMKASWLTKWPTSWPR